MNKSKHLKQETTKAADKFDHPTSDEKELLVSILETAMDVACIPKDHSTNRQTITAPATATNTEIASTRPSTANPATKPQCSSAPRRGSKRSSGNDANKKYQKAQFILNEIVQNVTGGKKYRARQLQRAYGLKIEAASSYTW